MMCPKNPILGAQLQQTLDDGGSNALVLKTMSNKKGKKHVAQGLTKDRHVEADSQSPDISNASVIGLPTTHFWGHESRCAGCSVDQVSHTSQLRAAEVCNLDMSICAQQQVVWLQVTVSYLVCMEVVQALQCNFIREGEREALSTDLLYYYLGQDLKDCIFLSNKAILHVGRMHHS